MALGDSIRALKITSRVKGWDPDVIVGAPGPAGKYSEDQSVMPFNKVPDAGELFGDKICGRLPEDIPANQQQFPKATGPVLGEKVSFNNPDVSRENKNRGTSGADPFPGGGWSEGL